MPSTKQRSVSRFILPLVVTAACVFGAMWLLVNRQYVVDQLSVWQYHPSSEVASFASRSGMSETGKFYFYASQPSLENAVSFNQTCGRKEKSTAILGCYNGQYIYIYNVQDSKLDGIREVTAAHEMLHAAYARLGGQEKKEVDALLETEYAKLKNDEKFAERMAFYARTEPGERDNELHSIIGTEIESISPELEHYYSKYFSQRHEVVELYAKYAGVFLALQTQSAELASQLAHLGDKIESDTLAYNKDTSQFNTDVERFKKRVDSSDFSSQDEYNNERSTLLQRADDLEARRKAINDNVTQYELLRAELKSVASQSEALNRSIDSSLAPAPSL